ncbi:GntR family transcriptional regulator [Terriglobus saanensis]|uniref:Transcriptional regulator, GntR family n=1 Tax=Terriglobus saanensis (strain ATCC BAA-1853 / DSM 23119 / SP1PR4) TaxID=401053 RepID=E8V6S0_TERSS|nr:GntR family transcriptional regulator [Terriglobus saanensis]ADV83872.1 transcriptional regulator, GntR family [Terriglobus saanensis SP1PR4]
MKSKNSSARLSFRFHLNPETGVPVYRQLIDQVHGALASGGLKSGEQLPTVRQLAVDLAINPNTVTRAYREMEIRGLLETQQGTGTFIAEQQTERDSGVRKRQMEQLVNEFVARAGASGFTLNELEEALKKYATKEATRRR